MQGAGYEYKDVKFSDVKIGKMQEAGYEYKYVKLSDVNTKDVEGRV